MIKFRPPRVEGSPLEAQAEASTAKVIGTQEALGRLGFMENSCLRAVTGNVAPYQAWEQIRANGSYRNRDTSNHLG